MQPNNASSPILALKCGDWSYQEQCEIDRVRAACMEHPHLSLEAGLTDEDDPWCIVYDRERERVIFHLARIDSSYIVETSDFRRKRIKTIAEAIDVALRGGSLITRGQRLLTLLGRQTHPRARFLIFPGRRRSARA
jgi:hypothetical protein